MLNEIIDVLENGGNVALYREELLKILKGIQEPKPVEVTVSWVEPTEVTATIEKPSGKVTVVDKAKKVLRTVKKS